MLTRQGGVLCTVRCFWLLYKHTFYFYFFLFNNQNYFAVLVVWSLLVRCHTRYAEYEKDTNGGLRSYCWGYRSPYQTQQSARSTLIDPGPPVQVSLARKSGLFFLIFGDFGVRQKPLNWGICLAPNSSSKLNMVPTGRSSK